MRISTQLIDSLLRRADIEGLIQLGAPTDEYSSEAQVIALALAELDDSEINAENITAIVSDVWRKSFGLAASDLEARRSAIDSFAKQLIQSQTTS